MRKKIPLDIEANVLTTSRRRCCICYGLHRDLNIKQGQIAHLDRDNTNNDFDNLAFLCFEHHDKYDSTTSQSKNFTIFEVKQYRDELYKNVLETHSQHYTCSKEIVTSSEDIKMKKICTVIIEIMNEHRVIFSLTDLATKACLSRNTVAEYLQHLNDSHIVRIDRTKTTFKERYSLFNSQENLVIDEFVSHIEEKVLDDDRFLRFKWTFFEVDAVIHTILHCYVVLVIMSEHLTQSRIKMVLNTFNYLKEKNIYGQNSIPIVLVGMKKDEVKNLTLAVDLEKENILVKYVSIVD